MPGFLSPKHVVISILFYSSTEIAVFPYVSPFQSPNQPAATDYLAHNWNGGGGEWLRVARPWRTKMMISPYIKHPKSLVTEAVDNMQADSGFGILGP